MNDFDPIEAFTAEGRAKVQEMGADAHLRELSLAWNIASARYQYTYHFSSLGRPIIQLPMDMVAVQELIWSVKPDLVVETGIAHGGSLVMSAGMLTLLDYADAVEAGDVMDPRTPRRRVIGVDIDIRSHNRAAIERHPMADRIELVEGSSVDEAVVDRIRGAAAECSTVLVMLDSNHTHEHVLAELEAYAPMTSVGSYCIVFDTVIEDLPADTFPDRPWGRGDNPKTAVHEFLRRLEDEGRLGIDAKDLRFEVDRAVEDKLLISVAPSGYLKRVR